MKKRHCMVVHAYYPVGEPRVQRETEALLDYGYEVDIICLRQKGESGQDQLNGANIYRLPVSRHKGQGIIVQFFEYLAFFFLAFWQLVLLYFRHHYGVIQLHNPPDFLVFAAVIPKLMGAKIILDLHDLTPAFYASRFKRNMQSFPVRLVCWQERIACRFADHIITVTEPWRQSLIDRGLPPHKCTVVMNVADSKIFCQNGEVLSSSQTAGLHLIYHGTLAQRYGIDLILHAIARLQHKLADLRLTIHGRGEFLAELQHLSQKLGLDECVYFSTEYMPIEELPKLIAEADLGLIPYRRDVFTDGILPTKLMEYAALGVPAIVARTPAISAYFDQTMVAFFTAGDVDELACCIESLYHDRSRLLELAHNIKKFNQNYSWTAQKNTYLNLLSRLHNQKDTPHQVSSDTHLKG